MKWQHLLITLAHCLVCVLGQTESSSSSSSSITNTTLPTCAASCLTDALDQTPCAPTNLTCLCRDEGYHAAATACVGQRCTVKESLVTKNMTDKGCGVEHRDISASLAVMALTLGITTAVVILMRVGFRYFVTGGGLGADDWAILVTLVVGIPGTVIIFVGTIPNGVGRDIWSLSFDQITRFLMFFYISEWHYFLTLTFLKLSMLLFYLRIFPFTAVRHLLWGTVVFDVVYGTTFVLVSVLQCAPVDYFWLSWDGEHRGACLNSNAVGWANAAISIVMDFWMLALPLSQLRSLRLHWKKKIGVALMFGVGIVVTVFSIIRLKSLVLFASSTNPTFDNYGVHYWSILELNVGMICTCMPAMRQLLVWLFPAVFGGTTQNGGGHYGLTNYKCNKKGSAFNVPRSQAWSERGGGSRASGGSGSGSGNRKKTLCDDETAVGNITVYWIGDETANSTTSVTSPKQPTMAGNAWVAGGPDLGGVRVQRSFQLVHEERTPAPVREWEGV